MEKNLNPNDYITINSRAKSCLVRFIIHFIKMDDNAKIVKPNNIKIDVFSTSEKSCINKIFYSMVIKSNNYNKKFDLKKNIPIYDKMKSINYPLKDECNNKINDNEISIKVDLLPYIQNKMVINFEFFNFFYYNGKIFHKFVINPDNYFDLKDNKKKLFIYFYGIENNFEVNKLKDDLNNIVLIKNIWKIISYIYLIIPVNNKDQAIEIYNKLPKFLKDKDNKNLKLSVIYLSDDIKDGGAINIFANLFKQKNKNYFFILNHNNVVYQLNEYSKIQKEIKKYIDYHLSKNDPVQVFENQRAIKKENLLKLFIFLTNFINDLSNLDYIFDFNYKMNFSIKLIENNFCFQLEKIDKIEIGGSLRTEHYKIFKKFFDIINDEDFKCNLKEIKTINIDIDFNKEIKCKVCKGIIPQEKECYYCYICKDFYCYKCVKNNFETNFGKKKFIDPKHNLLFFKTRKIEHFYNIDQQKLGVNSFVNSESFRSHHSASCDGCSSSFYNSQRFICITCKPGIYLSEGYNDYCTNCIEHMIKDDNIGKKIQKDIKLINYNYSNFARNHILKQMHDHNKHIYLMVALEGTNSSYQGF